MFAVFSAKGREAIFVRSYLAPKFLINGDLAETSDPGSDSVTELVVEGMELGYRDTWIYFSIRGSVPQDGQLTNTILFEVQPTQINRVKTLWAPNSATLVFTDREPSRSLVVSTQ